MEIINPNSPKSSNLNTILHTPKGVRVCSNKNK